MSEDIFETEVTIRPVDLPDGPRDTMSRLRGAGRFALLESALPMPRQAQWSYIAGPSLATLYTDEAATRLEVGGAETATWADPFEALAEVAAGRARSINIVGECPDGMDFIGGWVGVLGYELARPDAHGLSTARNDPKLPRQWWMEVDQVLGFHHPTGRWWHATTRRRPEPPFRFHGDSREATWAFTLARARGALPGRGCWRVGSLRQHTPRPEFEAGVRNISEAIARGDVLQVNLSRLEDAAFEGDAWALYEDLVAVHPAPFAAYLEGPGFAVASCSPERFLRRRGDCVEARPIKGTVARGKDVAGDEAQRQWLASSAKDRAENVMIVDLMRNDLGRVAAIGSVRVPELFALEPYASVWQMVSTVQAQLRPGCGIDELLRACWPPGSMTGAPKVKAMEIIETIEPLHRGWYAGSIGYLDCRGNMDLSVVIRTAVIADGRVMLQLGGAVVADSDPAAEWAETVAKGRDIVAVLENGGRPDHFRAASAADMDRSTAGSPAALLAVGDRAVGTCV
ncbi:MAG: aminodeoxychorismate synthase component I [Burkholderiales bacterium]|nr:aminodeoxychorismate synthase component I [Burkholderiales bacterium]